MSNNAAIVDIAQTASQFNSSIVLQADNKYIDVKSILGLFTTLVSSQSYEPACTWHRCRGSQESHE